MLHFGFCTSRGGPEHFAQVHDAFLQQLHATAGNLTIALRQQENLVARLNHSSQALKSSTESRPKKIQRLQAMFEQAEFLGPLKVLSTPLLMPLAFEVGGATGGRMAALPSKVGGYCPRGSLYGACGI